ncbi:MAG: hypothetical protein L3J33_08995 [Rhodobacteraceae bacterium]|nr:hypothetical protein [Paracoccaceae bacterium]
MKTLISLIFMAFAAPAISQEIMSAEEFDSFSVGTTLYFYQNGRFYGSEQFFEDRQSVWRAQDGSCVNGKWDEVENGICFLYDGSDELHCWQLTREDGTIMIESMFPPIGQATTILEVDGQDTIPIICTAPSLGV